MHGAVERTYRLDRARTRISPEDAAAMSLRGTRIDAVLTHDRFSTTERASSILYMRSVEDLTGRARIRDAALELFGEQGFAKANVRAIAARAGVSPALVGHHFGSKEGLREACDAHVVTLIKGGPDAADALADPAGLAAMLESSTSVRRYLARAFLDGSEAAAGLFDEIVAATAAFLDEGTRDGRVEPASDPRTRAAVYVTWLLAPLVFDAHIARVLDIADVHDPAATMRFSRTSIEMLTRGVFRDDSVLDAWDAAQKEMKRP